FYSRTRIPPSSTLFPYTTLFRSVRPLNDFLFIGKLLNDNDRSEDFLLHRLHVRSHIGNNRRFIPITALKSVDIRLLTACKDCSTIFSSRLYISINDLQLLTTNNRTDMCPFIQWISEFELFRFFYKLLNEIIINGFMNEHAGACFTRLARIKVNSKQRTTNSRFHVPSSKTIFGDFPPSSSVVRFNVCDAFSIISLPVGVDPVNATLF